jgi:hypothetical protein
VRVRLILWRSASLAGAALLMFVAPAYAAGAGVHAPLVSADLLGVGHLAGSVFGGIGHVVLGAFTWTVKLASTFILVTLGALVRLLIPASWAHEGVAIMRWIVAILDYAGTVSTPGGGRVYGFAGINDLRDLFTWLGTALLPLTLVYATSRAMVGHGDHVAIPIIRVAVLGALLISYPYWWAQGAAVINQMTDMVLSLAPVSNGIHKVMLYAVEGVALGGWQLIDLTLMGALGIARLSLIFLKVVIILLGALLYATGPIMLGLVPTDAGAAISRAWLSAVGMLLLLPIAWAAVFAVDALLINDAGTAGPLVAGNTDVGRLLGGVLLAVAGLATLWICLRLAREAASLLRIQLGGMLSLAASGHRASATSVVAGRSQSAASSIRTFQSRVQRRAQRCCGGVRCQRPRRWAACARRSDHRWSGPLRRDRHRRDGDPRRRRQRRPQDGQRDRTLTRGGGRGADGQSRHRELAAHQLDKQDTYRRPPALRTQPGTGPDRASESCRARATPRAQRG